MVGSIPPDCPNTKRPNAGNPNSMTRADLQRLSFEYLRNGPKPDWNARP